MATTSEHVESKVNTTISDDDRKKKEEATKLQSLSTGDIEQNQGNKTTEKADDLMEIIGKTDTLSSVKSTNEDKKSDRTLPTSYIHTEKKNEEKTVETTTIIEKKEELGSTSVSSAPTNDKNIKKEETTATVVTSNSGDNAFHIEKGDAEHLTDFQRQKAKYFFNVNLDIENKEYVTWEDVEFYLLFHATAAGKEGSDGGDLESRLSRATRAFWEHIHDQVPLADKNRDKLTLDQFLDTWASLIDYVVRTNQLPPIVQDLVKYGFELYSTDNGDGKPGSIQISAFDQLFQKMNLGRPFAIMAYKAITENGTRSLDAETIDTIVRAVITSSDDEHESHFLLPGFFKTIMINKKDEKHKTPSPVPDNKPSEASDKSTSPPPAPPSSSSSSTAAPPSQVESSPPQQQQLNPPTSPHSQQSNGPAEQTNGPASPHSQQPNSPASRIKQANGPTSSSSQQQKPNGPAPQQNGPSSSFSHSQQQPSAQKQSGSISQGETVQPPAPGPPTNQQPATIQQEDENIRRLLHFYHIDDGDVVEVAGGSKQRLILVHPERPIPPYIKQNNHLLQKLQPGSTTVSSAQQNHVNVPPSDKPNSNGKSSSQATTTPEETKPKVRLEERVSRGEAQQGATVPLRQESKQNNLSSTGVRQVYPPLSEHQQEEQRKQAKLQATQPLASKEKEGTSVNNVSSSKQDETKEKKDSTHNDEDKIVAAVLKQLAPIIQKRVAAEVRRLTTDDSDNEDDDSFNPFQLMFAGGSPFFAGGLPPQGFQQQRGNQSAPDQRQHQANRHTEGDFGGLPGGASFIPPQLLMAMMSDMARGGAGGEIPGFHPNMPPPPRGPGGAPVGVGGYMMFVDDDQMMGGASHPGPRF